MNRLLVLALLLSAMFSTPVLSGDEDPPSAVGNWSWTWKDPKGVTHRHVLKVTKAGEGKLAADEVFDEEKPVKADKLVVNGKTVEFLVTRGDKEARYKGTFKGKDVIDGLVYITHEGQATEYAWTAKRQKDGD